MSRVNDLIEKYGLRDACVIRGAAGQKMDDDCIQKFVEADPSGNGKYLDWMFLQAGGGQERMDRSITQWEKGDHGEAPVRDTIRDHYVKDAVKGYKDENGRAVRPVTEAVALDIWNNHEEKYYRLQHIFGDEEYALTGFGFYRSWPGHNQIYEQIVQSVHRFHRYQQKLKSMSKSIDLNAKNYPNLRDLMEALCDITVLEIKNHLDFDTVYEDDRIVVICPLNIGASLKFGHQKWCTANESMFKQAVSGTGQNRWKEYAKDGALYYARFKNHPASVVETPVQQVAIQTNHGKIGVWKFFDTGDTSHDHEVVKKMVWEAFGSLYTHAWESALHSVSLHLKNYPKSRLNLEFVVKS